MNDLDILDEQDAWRHLLNELRTTRDGLLAQRDWEASALFNSAYVYAGTSIQRRNLTVATDGIRQFILTSHPFVSGKALLAEKLDTVERWWRERQVEQNPLAMHLNLALQSRLFTLSLSGEAGSDSINDASAMEQYVLHTLHVTLHQKIAQVTAGRDEVRSLMGKALDNMEQGAPGFGEVAHASKKVGEWLQSEIYPAFWAARQAKQTSEVEVG